MLDQRDEIMMRFLVIASCRGQAAIEGQNPAVERIKNERIKRRKNATS
jgi:hypothetical protein